MPIHLPEDSGMHEVRVVADDAPTAPGSLYRHARVGSEHASTHVLQVYEDEAFFARTVADFLVPALVAGRPAISIATAEHLAALVNAIDARQLPAQRYLESGQLRLLDARETLDRISVDGEPAEVPFVRVIGGLIEECARDFGGPVHAHGEMVDLLWRAGERDAAAELELLWNDLAEHRHFHLLCTYPLQGFADAGQSQAFETICHQHERVVPTERYVELGSELQLREVARLQQRAAALETELVRREQSLARELRARQEAEAANRAKSDFLAVMSHELCTPLNAIAGYVELLELGVRGQVTEAQRDDLARIRKSQRHLMVLINDVLNYARIESGAMRYELVELSLCDVLQSADELIRPQLARAGLTLVLQPDDDGVRVRADVEKVRQILLNLLSNAVKFTDRGGEVRIWCERGVDGDGGAVGLLHVRDTGKGSPAGKLDAVFDPFVQVHTGLTRPHDGTGLGLAISRDLARGMGGNLVVRSVAGAGSTFTLSLPLA
jgi:signal transduction histidine kinase